MDWEPIFKLFSSPKTAWAVLSIGSVLIALILLLWSIGGELKLKYLYLQPVRNKLLRGIENVHRREMLDRLENNKGNVDLITIDINSARHELVSKGLIEELPEKKYKGLMPSSVNPVLLKHL